MRYTTQEVLHLREAARTGPGRELFNMASDLYEERIENVRLREELARVKGERNYYHEHYQDAVNERDSAEARAERLSNSLEIQRVGYEKDLQRLYERAERLREALDNLRKHCDARHRTVSTSIAAEVLSGNKSKELAERTALVEIESLQQEVFRASALAAEKPESNCICYHGKNNAQCPVHGVAAKPAPEKPALYPECPECGGTSWELDTSGSVTRHCADCGAEIQPFSADELARSEKVVKRVMLTITPCGYGCKDGKNGREIWINEACPTHSRAVGFNDAIGGQSICKPDIFDATYEEAPRG